MRSLSISGSNASESCRCPAVVTRATGRQRRSASRWILVVSPPRDRPRASRSRRWLGAGGGLLSFGPAPCVARQGHPLAQHRDQPFRRDVLWRFVPRTRSMLMGAHHRGIDAGRPLRPLPLIAALTRERTRHYCRLEKLLEDALIKVSAVASKLDTLSVRDMLEALIGGERDPQVLAGLARGRMRAKHDRLVQALTGKFDDHHAELAQMLLDQVDALSAQIGKLTTRIEELIAAIPAAQGVDADGTTGPTAGLGARAPVLPAVDRLDEVTGIGREAAQAIVAEVGLHMSVFPTPAHLVSWAKISPRTIQSGARSRTGRTGKGNPYLKGVLGEAAAAAGKTDTFLGERYRRLVKRRGKLKALVAIARSILVIVWHLLADRATRYHDLGASYYAGRIDKNRKMRDHVRQLEALGYTVTLTQAA